MENLLSWVHPGFSVFAGEPLSPDIPGFLFSPESLSPLKMPGNLSGSRVT